MKPSKKRRGAKAVRILLAERDKRTRAAIRALLSTNGTAQIVAEASNSSQILRQIRAHRPDVVLLDLSAPRVIGLDTLARIRRRHPSARVIVLSGNPTGDRIGQAVRAGVDGYLVKDAAYRLDSAVRSVAAGETYLSPVASQLLKAAGVNNNSRTKSLERLPPRQREVLRLIAEGYSNKQIGPILGVSIKTVDSHRTRLMRRLRVHDVTGLVRYAIRVGLVSADH